MNKKVFGRKFSRSRPAREALFASLMRGMILNGQIKTTKAKAKAVQGTIEKLVTSAKKADLSSKRRILSSLDNARDAFDILFQRVAPAFSNRTSGYTRIVNLPTRKGDSAKLVRMEWTDKIELGKPEVKEKKAKAEKELKPKKATKK